jgi:hypothetical protein
MLHSTKVNNEERQDEKVMTMVDFHSVYTTGYQTSSERAAWRAQKS